MSDKSFSQAMQDLRDKIAVSCHESISRMLLQRTTATDATRDIQDENMRDIVTDELIASQIIALLALLRDLQVVDEEQYKEFVTYLQRHRLFQNGELIAWGFFQ
ncbi:MAG TPA: hypothetical protein VFN35_15850 [Ktedonobacteraceae bacterium]|nr:hypothetical protein [Ktedonobacteraceae bacterium]